MEDKIVRSQVMESDDEKIIKYQVQDKGDSDDKLIRHQVMGIGGEVPEPVLTTLNVTANGTYTPEAGVDGFNEVNVDVDPTLENISVTENGTYTPSSGYDGIGEVVVNVDKTRPDEVNLIDFDFTNNNLHDSIRNFDIPTQNYSNIGVSNLGITFNATNSNCLPSFVPTTNSFYEIKVKFGTNTNTDPIGSYNALLKFNRTDSHQTLTFCRDVTIDENPQGTWRLNDESGNVQYLSVGYGDSHYFDDKELIIEYGYYYNDGVFTPNYNKFSYKIGSTYIYIGTSNFIINPNGNPIILLGGGGAVMKGAVIESLKVKQIFKWN